MDSFTNIFSIKKGALDSLRTSILHDINLGKFVFGEDVNYISKSVGGAFYYNGRSELENMPVHLSKIMGGFFFPIDYTEEQIVYRLTLLNSVYNLELTDSDIEQLTTNIISNE